MERIEHLPGHIFDEPVHHLGNGTLGLICECFLRLISKSTQYVGDDFLLGSPPAVDCRPADARPLRNLLEADRPETALDKQPERRVKNSGIDIWASRAADRSVGRCAH